MNVKKLIENYVPFNEQEERDKKNILKYIDTYCDVLNRSNEVCHFSSSGFILNENKDKVLMIHHNLYNSWGWTGGHVDGDSKFLEVALREAKEETGIENVKPLVEDIFVLDILPVWGHVKRGSFVSSHLHLSLAYLLEASEYEILKVKEDENSGVKWFPLDSFLEHVSEKDMKPVYTKILTKAKKTGVIK